MHLSGNSQPPSPSTGVRNGRYTSTVKQPPTSASLPNQPSPFKRYSQTTLTQTSQPMQANSTSHKEKQNTHQTPSPPNPMTVLAPASKPVGRTPSPPLPRRSEEAVPSPMGNLLEYDTLSDAQEAASKARAKLLGSYSPRRSESPKSGNEEGDNIFSSISGKQWKSKGTSSLGCLKTIEVDRVELRSEKIPSPSAEPEVSNLDKGARLPPTKTELHQLKKLAHEPLINVSEVTQQRRNADYIDIDLPSDRNSDFFSENSGSLNSSLYSVPSSLPAFSAEQVYDIPTTTNPRNMRSRPHALSDPS